jgi:site-specific DNA-methyltransferase (adenine-specific)
MPKPYYEDEFVTLFHGDCLEVTDWLDADVLVTDPPYGIAWTQNSMHYTRSIIPTKNAVKNDENTDVRDEVLLMWGDKPAIVFGSWRMPKPEKTKQRLIWHKTKLNPGMSKAPWYSADEEIYIIGKGFTGKPKQTVIQTYEARGGGDGLSAQTGHPTPKPVGLMEQLISKCPAGVVADPFAGSGATLIAARNLGRKAIGVELEEKYCEIIARRLSQQAFNFEELQNA